MKLKVSLPSDVLSIYEKGISEHLINKKKTAPSIYLLVLFFSYSHFLFTALLFDEGKLNEHAYICAWLYYIEKKKKMSMFVLLK
jgi:hypothetical protein